MSFHSQRWRCPILLLLSILVLPVLPDSVHAQAQRLLVSSRNTNSIKAYDAGTGAFLGDLVPPGRGGLIAPQEVLFAPNGNILVSGRGNTAILAYDASGAFLGPFTSGYALDNPTKMTFGPDGRLYVSQWGATRNKVARFDGTTGVFVDEFTSIGLNGAGGHAWDASGRLYVAVFGSSLVRRFDTAGNDLGLFTAPLRLVGPINLWFGAGGDLYVADWSQGAVLVFDGATGAFKSTFVSGLSNVEGFAFAPDGSLLLCDWTLNRVNRYSASGGFLEVFSDEGGMLQPNSLDFEPAGGTPTLRTTWGGLKQRFR